VYSEILLFFFEKLKNIVFGNFADPVPLLTFRRLGTSDANTLCNVTAAELGTLSNASHEQVPEHSGNSTHDQENMLLRNFHLKKYEHRYLDLTVEQEARLATEGKRMATSAKFKCTLEGCNSSFTRKDNLISGLIFMHR